MGAGPSPGCPQKMVPRTSSPVHRVLCRESQALLCGYQNWMLLTLCQCAVILRSPSDVDWLFCVFGGRCSEMPQVDAGDAVLDAY